MGEVAQFRQVNGRNKVLMKRSDMSEAHLATVVEGLRQTFAAHNGRTLRNFRELSLPAEMVEKYQRQFIQECRKLQTMHPDLPYSGGERSIVTLTRRAHPDLFDLMQTERVEDEWTSDVELVG